MRNLETGDIVLTSKGSIITWFMSLFQKDEVIWGHCLIARNSDKLWEAFHTLREVDADERFSQISSYKILRFKSLTDLQKSIILREGPKLLGEPYGYFRIFLQMFDQIFNTDWFTSRAENEYLQVCSSYIAWIYDKACDYHFNGVEWTCCDPDDIDDDSILNAHRWEIVEEKLSNRQLKRQLKRDMKASREAVRRMGNG